jgi:hypothetical protein
MSSASSLNYHAPPAHNERVKALIKKFEIKLNKAHGLCNEIIWREDRWERIEPAEEAQYSDLLLQIRDNVRTLEQLDSLLLPEEN